MVTCIPDARYQSLSADESLSISDDEFLADVDPAITAASTPDLPRFDDPEDTTWQDEAITLDHLSESSALVEAAQRSFAAPKRTNRHAGLAEVQRLTRSGMTIAEAGAALGLEEHEAAGALTKSRHDAPRVLEIEMLLRRHRNWSYGKIAGALHEPTTVHMVSRLARILGLDGDRTLTAHERIDRSVCERIRAAIRADVATHGRPRWAEIGRQVGLDRGTVARTAKRNGWVS